MFAIWSQDVKWFDNSFKAFYSKLCTYDYLIHTTTFSSAGQWHAESAILGVFAFGFYQKMHVRILYPQFFLKFDRAILDWGIDLFNLHRSYYESIHLDHVSNLLSTQRFLAQF